ncbi:MAG: phage holin family protein [Solirubrobacterales bacterium]
MSIPPENTPLGESISDIIDRTTTIVHEEIELAKAEMAVALQDLLRGSVAGIVGGVFAFFGLFILLIALSFLVADAIGTWYPWLGFFIVAFLCFGMGGLLAFVALKKIKKGSQLAPSQAISEARQTKEALQAEAEKPLETIDSVAVEEPAPGTAAPGAVAATVKPAEKTAEHPDVAEAKEDLKEARADAEELELDAKELKKRAKQEAKEAKLAAKAARVAEQEAAKADAIADKAAEKAEKEAAKAAAQAETDAAKAAKAAEKQAEKSGSAPEAPPTQPEVQAQPYVAPTPPQPAAPQPPQPPAPPSQSPPPAQPPEPPRDTSKPYDPKSDN